MEEWEVIVPQMWYCTAILCVGMGALPQAVIALLTGIAVMLVTVSINSKRKDNG